MHILLNGSVGGELSGTSHIHDGTHLKLKHYFFTVLSEKLEFSALNKMPISVLMLDIDFFKKFNDTYGHACGDFVLQKVSRSIFDSIRGQDLAGRYGGEEFVVMLYNTDAEAAMMVAERIRKNIAEQELVYENNKMSLTISIGVSVFDVENPITAKELVEMADRALYQSKANGRNRVTLADENTPPVQGK
ncbi:MAG: GGDEF domain-containing protein [Spirochaetaceae bacterium]|nr:GGDEF domain-containing protein [Spirochaetaceae bacterium]